MEKESWWKKIKSPTAILVCPFLWGCSMTLMSLKSTCVLSLSLTEHSKASNLLFLLCWSPKRGRTDWATPYPSLPYIIYQKQQLPFPYNCFEGSLCCVTMNTKKDHFFINIDEIHTKMQKSKLKSNWNYLIMQLFVGSNGVDEALVGFIWLFWGGEV